MEVMLSCGTITLIEDVWSKVNAQCPIHHMPDVITAIETREWHVKCHSCRYGRWVGASNALALIVERKHLANKPDHKTSVDFIVPDDVREKWRQVFGRKRFPRRFINPQERDSAKSVYATFAARAINTTTDEPPF